MPRILSTSHSFQTPSRLDKYDIVGEELDQFTKKYFPQYFSEDILNQYDVKAFVTIDLELWEKQKNK